MYFCTVNGNSRVMICTLSSARWQQASKLSILRRFELIIIIARIHSHTYTNTVATTLCQATAQLLQNLESKFILKVP